MDQNKRANAKEQQTSSTIENSLLRELASIDPITSLATQTDQQLAAIARHLLPDMAGELLAHRLAERSNMQAR